MVSVRLADKMPLTRENLIGMMKILRAKADEVSEGVGDNWFPCGFAGLHVRGDCPLVKLRDSSRSNASSMGILSPSISRTP